MLFAFALEYIFDPGGGGPVVSIVELAMLVQHFAMLDADLCPGRSRYGKGHIATDILAEIVDGAAFTVSPALDHGKRLQLTRRRRFMGNKDRCIEG